MISAVVLTKNEEKNLEPCLKSLCWCSEIIVIDDFSTDKTLTIAKAHRVKIFKHHLRGDFSKQRNFGLQKATCDWVLFIDADEIVTPALKKEIITQIKTSQAIGFYFSRQEIFLSNQLRHGETARIKLLRLAKKNAGLWQRPVHESWQISGPTQKLQNPLLHFSHPSLTSFLEKINFYSSLHAQSLAAEGKTAGLWKIIFYPIGKFFQNYFLYQGFLDGMPGFVMALAMSLHSFLAHGQHYLAKK